ncbi:MAG: family 78 glycoside hydrolase catalytic domain [Bacteroidota bacterium]|nr:family 78 glycoside hydrolase catalytic domain [Bacteroidota bacterium]
MKRLFFLVFLFVPGIAALAKINPEKLTCEYLQNPSVVDVSQPRLAWVNIAGKGERGQVQTAWQIRVATSKKKLKKADLWDSQKQSGEQNNRVIYAGKPLQSRTECWWQVRVWDKNGKASSWSEPAFWRMGVLTASEWKAKWIGAPWEGEEHFQRPNFPGQQFEDFGPAAPMLRKSFRIEKQVKSAVAFVTGLGYFEFYVNGRKAGGDVLVPNITNYGKRPLLGQMLINVEDNFKEYKVMYLAYDVTSLLSKGENAIGAILGNGFYNPRMFWCEGYGTPRFIGQLHIIYTDGSEEIVASDESWKAAKSPILKNMVYYGETYDARMEQPDWCNPIFNAEVWENAAVKKAPFGKLVAQTSPSDKVMEQLQPVKIEKLANGNYKVDFGKEISGWVCLKNVVAPAGHRIDIAFNSNQYSGDNTYIFSGNGPENYAPRFNWFVFSGVEIKNWHGELKPENIVAESVYTEVPISSVFETSNPLFNRINDIWRTSQQDNMHGAIASDCPHRERNGYTGDGQVACVTVMHNFDSKAFYQKWIADMLGAQDLTTGYVPNGAPWQPGCGGGVAWGAAICIMPWEFYLHTGAKDMLTDNFEGMKEYIRYMQTWVDQDGIMFSKRTGNDGNILKWYNLGDWVTPGDLPADEMVHTFYFWRCADLTAQTAKVLGKSDEAKKYADLAEQTRKAFWKRFYDETNGSYGKSGGNIFALKMGVPTNQYSRVISALKADIKANKGHLDTGIFGTQFFFEVMSENGMHDMAYEAINKKEEPGFGRWLELGSTTTREQWSEEGSHNHPMFGGGLVWFYRKLAGMNADPEKPGYKHIVFHPQPVADLSFVKYYNQTVYGEAGIEWKKENGTFSAKISVPVGCQATVYVPVMKGKVITENGRSITDSKEVKFLKEEEGYQVFMVKSGKYEFVSR